MDSLVLKAFILEIFLSVCILSQLVYNAILVNASKNKYPLVSTELFSQTFFILSCVLILALNLKSEGYFINFLFINDIGSNFVKILFVFSCLGVLILVVQNFKLQFLNFFEYFILYLLSILALLLLINANDLLAVYLVIEMQALCFYVLASFSRDSAFSTEAGLKYFISGSFISAIFLAGCAILYGLFGTLNLNHLTLLLSLSNLGSDSLFYAGAVVGNLLIIITFLFKLAVVPFHFWAPDAYEGAPLSSTIIFTILPKLGIFYFLIKWLSIIVLNFNCLFSLLSFLGVASVAIGSFFALAQKRIKRLIIYSSIGQLGFVIAALSDLSLSSLVSVYFFLVIYIITSLLFWVCLSNFYMFQQQIRRFYSQPLSTLFITSLANLFNINMGWSIVLLVIFFSMMGLPPFSGFFAKVFILVSLIESSNLIIALLLVLLNIVSAFYYLRFLKILFFEPSTAYLTNDTSQVIFLTSFFRSQCIFVVCLAYLLVFFFFNPSFLYLICHNIIVGSTFF